MDEGTRAETEGPRRQAEFAGGEGADLGDNERLPMTCDVGSCDCCSTVVEDPDTGLRDLGPGLEADDLPGRHLHGLHSQQGRKLCKLLPHVIICLRLGQNRLDASQLVGERCVLWTGRKRKAEFNSAGMEESQVPAADYTRRKRNSSSLSGWWFGAGTWPWTSCGRGATLTSPFAYDPSPCATWLT